MRRIRFLQALNEALHQEMERDPDIYILGEDIRGALRGETKGLYDRFGGDRVIDTPISEAGFTGMGNGIAMSGCRAIIEYQICPLVYLAFDQIVNQAQKLRYMMGGQGRFPVTYLVMASGIGNGTAGQHSDNPYPYFIHAGVKSIVPATAYDAKGLMVAAIRDDDPVAIFPQAQLLGARGEVPEEPYVIPLGVGDIKRKGTDVTIAATGVMVLHALKVAETLQEEGVSVEVYDPRSVYPWDRELLLESVAKTGRLVICDDANRTCGFAAEVSAVVAEEAFDSLKAPIKRVARPNVPVPYSRPMEEYVQPSPERLAAAVRAVMGLESATAAS